MILPVFAIFMMSYVRIKRYVSMLTNYVLIVLVSIEYLPKRNFDQKIKFIIHLY